MKNHNYFKNKKLNQKGFTALELALIIVITAVVCGIVGYSVSQIRQKKQTSTQTTDVRSTDPQTQTKESDTTSQKATEVKLPDQVNYPEPVFVTKKSEVSKLTDTSDVFKNYIASMVGVDPDYTAGCDQPKTVSVSKVYKDEFALGAIGDCGGGYQIWKKTGDSWALATGGQEIPGCSVLKKYSIPKEIYDKCADESNNYEIVPNTL
jgi:Tfp pilus assembly major pilin PilA